MVSLVSDQIEGSPVSPLRQLPEHAAQILEQGGFAEIGVLTIRRYDELVPPGWQSEKLLYEARSALVLGCGGDAFERALARAPEAELTQDPVDQFTARIVAEAGRALEEAGHPSRSHCYWDRLSGQGWPDEAGEFVDLLALGQAAGLGVPGRLRILLHPRFGPWLALRGVLLTTLELSETPPLSDFDPCTGCSAPCAQACRGRAFDYGDLDLPSCVATRERVVECETSCAARRACVIGPEHAYGAEMEAHFMRTSLRFARQLHPGVGPGR